MDALAAQAPFLIPLGVFLAVGAVFAAALAPAWVQERTPAIAELVRQPASPVPELLKSVAGGTEPNALPLEVRLAQAGIDSQYAPHLYLALRVALFVGLPLLVLLLTGDLGLLGRGGLVLLTAGLGYYLPPGLIAYLRKRRVDLLSRSFPDALDMLVSCLEAGLGLDSALRYVGRELVGVAPHLARELQLLNTEVGAGVPRAEALANLDRRTGLAELRALIAVLTQAERFGAGVAASLRPHAALTRRQRGLAAEQKAAQAAPLMTVAMILFVLPALFTVLIGPTIVNVTVRLMPALSRGGF